MKKSISAAVEIKRDILYNKEEKIFRIYVTLWEVAASVLYESTYRCRAF
ncbi:hypothetical protein [Ruminococcus flavefaciens]|nr:hypothetical protein [Ruminococcus flavefaciens]